MPLLINVSVPKVTQEPALPAGTVFVTPKITLDRRRVLVDFIYWASSNAERNNAQPLDGLPADLPPRLIHVLTRAEYAATPDLIGISHTKMREQLEAVPWIGPGNVSIVNFQE